MSLTPALIAAFATLFAAGIAATVSLVVSVLSKEQKTSEFRQQWIDSLRNDIAEWIGEVAVINELAIRLEQAGSAESEEASKRLHANLVKIRMLRARIELRLNPKEHVEMIRAMNRVRAAVKESTSALETALGAAVEVSQRLLKAEWMRVRTGEPAFVRTKKAAAMIIVAALLSIAGVVVLAWRTTAS